MTRERLDLLIAEAEIDYCFTCDTERPCRCDERGPICSHGQRIGAQGGIAQGHIDECEGEADEIRLMDFYSACDCCDTLMHKSTVGHGYKVMKDGRTLCIPCTAGEAQEDFDE